jgi:hypothetical protein
MVFQGPTSLKSLRLVVNVILDNQEMEGINERGGI